MSLSIQVSVIIIRPGRKNDFMDIEQAEAVLISQGLEIIAVEFIDHGLATLEERFAYRNIAGNHSGIRRKTGFVMCCVHFATRFR